MSDIFQILLEAFPAGAISASCFSIAAFLGRNKIKHWFNRDLEQLKANFQRELESIKSGHQRELEAYKVSLIAEAEKTKAEQGVRSAVALRFSEQQFTAINAINAAYADMGHKAIGLHLKYSNLHYMVTERGLSLSDGKEMIDVEKVEFDNRSRELTASIFSAKLFMKEEDVELLHNYDAILCGVVQSGLYNFLSAQGLDIDEGTAGIQLAQAFNDLASMDDKKNYIKREEAKVSKTLRRYADHFISMQGVERGF